jgi:hypothetical protein
MGLTEQMVLMVILPTYMLLMQTQMMELLILAQQVLKQQLIWELIQTKLKRILLILLDIHESGLKVLTEQMVKMVSMVQIHLSI